MRRRLLALVTALFLGAVGLASPVGSAPAQATPVVNTVQGCGTDIGISDPDLLAVGGVLLIQNATYNLSGRNFACILGATQWALGPFVLPLGFVLAANGSVGVQLKRVGGCLIVCSPLPGPNDIQVNILNGNADACLGFAWSMNTSANPNKLDFQCLAARAYFSATTTTGLSFGSCPKANGGSGTFGLLPEFPVNNWSVVNGQTVNGLPPFKGLTGFLGGLINPLIIGLISKCVPAVADLTKPPVVTVNQV